MVKRFLMILLTFVLLVTLNVNVLAGSVVDEMPSTVYFPYWKLETMFVTYTSGHYAVFDFPSNFLLTDQTIEQTVILESRDFTKQLAFYVSFVDADNSSLFNVDVAEVVFDFTGIESIDFVFEDSVITSADNIRSTTVNGVIAPPMFTTNLNHVEHYQYTFEYVRPIIDERNSTFFFYNDFLSSDNAVPVSVPYTSLYYLGVTNDMLDHVVSQYVDEGYSRANTFPYFSHGSVHFEFSHSLDTNYFSVILPLASTSSNVKYNYGHDVYAWIEKYYQYVEGDLTLDYNFADFIGVVLGGFFGMELFYEITIGHIVLAIFAVFFVKAFLKYFAGG